MIRNLSAQRMKLTIAHLYPEAMDLYGDRGNVMAIQRRCQWRGIEVDTVNVHVGKDADLSDVDLIVMGGGQDTAQEYVAVDLHRRGAVLRDLIDQGAGALAVCGGYQLFGATYTTALGKTFEGIGVFDVHTTASDRRFIGNIAVDARLRRSGAGRTKLSLVLSGFENHSGLTHLGTGAMPLGYVIHGAGNLGDGSTEGALYKKAIGTYLHGPLLPKNPLLADHLISSALAHRYGTIAPLVELDDAMELSANRVALERCETGRVAEPLRRLAG